MKMVNTIIKVITGAVVASGVHTHLKNVFREWTEGNAVAIASHHALVATERDFPELLKSQLYREIERDRPFPYGYSFHHTLMDPCFFNIESNSKHERDFFHKAQQNFHIKKCPTFHSCSFEKEATGLTSKWKAFVKEFRTEKEEHCEQTPASKAYTKHYNNNYPWAWKEDVDNRINIASVVVGVVAAEVAVCAKDKLRNKIAQLRRQRTNRP